MTLNPTTNNATSQWKIWVIAAVLLSPFLIFFDTARSIVSIWNSSETFAHGYIIFPISLWLIWQRRKNLARMPAVPFWPALLLLAACGFGWLLAVLGDVQVVRQYAFVAMLPLAVLALLGWRISWVLAFPLLYLFLAVPFGDIFINPLIEFTADFTVAALQASGIPVLRNGTSFDIPSGSWSVVVACSGVRYLISSFTLGCLFAYLTYRSRWRQVLFILLSIIVPIIANGLRAYMIVMIGHYSGMTLAVGVDHLIYGWLFFGVVMFLMFWIGSFWREDQDTPQAIETINLAPASAPASTARMLAIAVGTVACIGLWPLLANYIAGAGINPAPAKLSGFQSNWQTTQPFTQWKAKFSPANAELLEFVQRDAQQVAISVRYYRNQQQGAGLISSSNLLVPDEDPVWRRTGSSVRNETIANRQLVVRESRLHSAGGSLLIWNWYWIDGKFTVNDYVGKLLQAKEKLLLRGDDGASMMVYAPYAENPDEARAALRNFLSGNLTSLEATLAANKKL